ncbi:MAG: hypothetical protein PVI30_24295 [Myxococcales bacterium]|jgi:hypothetical protein
MLRTGLLVSLPLLLACAGAPPDRPESGRAVADGAGPLELSPSLRALLLEEMRAIEHAMPELQAAVAVGDRDTVARLGDEIAGTFILRQKVTAQQRHELHHGVPRLFLRMDHRFHDEARWLADAARQAQPPHVADHYRALLTACTRCHERFAPAVLPSLPTVTPPEPCSAAWYAHVEQRVGVADAQGHGPDPGSDEWKSAVEFRLAVRDDESFPDPASAAWCERIDALLPDPARR